ncbi:hypothetical protein XBLMG947_4042 [Xanthomonas bromi]|uniref:Uncharacterized protein n=2 Tax=Xanthomonas bromi TaxID=56449 RepID=A0A1C3NS66_9XANT|nr:hypothetical protein [Xanthomonas bromi]SBV53231.1 hypothetical protein XBLMG947_4042 [Xanthomonas bromi]
MMTVVKGLVTFRPMFALVLLSALVGCASAPKKAPPPSSFDDTMSRAEAEVTSGGAEQALKTFEDAGRADPTRKEPWVRMAQLQFDRANYARAIVAAQEVLQRDPNDLVADGVLTVAGFRIANQSLQRLQGRGALASGTARKEAETLASTLRATMGDDILQPDEPKKRKPSVRNTRRAAPSAAKDPAPAKETPKASADPFQNLGGN